MTVKSYTTAEEINPCAIVKFDDDGKLVVATSSTDNIIGIAENNHSSEGDVMDVCLSGECVAIAGGTISPGEAVTANEEGLTISAADGDNTVGIALTSANEGEDVTVLVAIGRITFTSSNATEEA
ncbi:MAG: DUF2190 family protein [Candidatus Gastranaerophilales bacterium]|nr:DUF2190 family protein [Candidatus Gastranaerophilales bacterium]